MTTSVSNERHVVHVVVVAALTALLCVSLATKGLAAAISPQARTRITLLTVVWLTGAIGLLISPIGIVKKYALLLLTFLIFWSYLIHRIRIGETDCGCFGLWSPPIQVMSILDCSAIALLVLTYPVRLTRVPSQWRVSLRYLAFSCIFVGGWTSTMMLSREAQAMAPDNAAAISEDVRVKSTVLLQPRRWLGKPFPLKDQIKIDADLTVGTWIVGFFSADCGACRSEVVHFRAFADELVAQRSDVHAAFVQLPPYASESDPLFGSKALNCYRGYLPNDVEWLIKPPSIIVIRDGTVDYYASGISAR